MAEQDMGLGAALVAALAALEPLPILEPPPWYQLIDFIEGLDLTIEEAIASESLEARFECGYLEHLPLIHQPLIEKAKYLQAVPVVATNLPDGW